MSALTDDELKLIAEHSMYHENKAMAKELLAARADVRRDQWQEEHPGLQVTSNGALWSVTHLTGEPIVSGYVSRRAAIDAAIDAERRP